MNRQSLIKKILREGLNLPKKPSPLIELIMAYEDGTLTDPQILELFSQLIKTGQAWSLQGSYGRMARNLIEAGYLDKAGNILEQP
jgi:hypothetical protein